MAGRKLFIAGATGVVGRAVVKRVEQRGVDFVAHVRPKRAAGGELPPRAVPCELSDAQALAGAMRGCTTVLQLIGTMRSRFGAGDTYETSDIGTTRQLVDAARVVGVDHLVLLSSVGAGRPVGPYLKAKAKAEAIVRDSGLPFTLFRPSAFTGGPAGRDAPAFFKSITHLLGLKSMEPIHVDELAAALVQAAVDRAPLGAALEGASLWELVERTKGG